MTSARFPTTYRLWPSQTARAVINLGVWDSRVFNQNLPPHEQIDAALFTDEFTYLLCGQIGNAFTGSALAMIEMQAHALRKQKVENYEQQHFRHPLTEEEKAKLSVFAAGLGDLEINLPEEPSEG